MRTDSLWDIPDVGHVTQTCGINNLSSAQQEVRGQCMTSGILLFHHLFLLLPTSYFSLSLHPSYSRLFLPPSKSSFLSVSLFLFLSICYPCLFQPRFRVSVLCTHNVCSIFLFISFILTSTLRKCFLIQHFFCLVFQYKVIYVYFCTIHNLGVST